MVLNIFAYIKLCEYTQIAVANIQFFYYFFQIFSLNGIKDFKVVKDFKEFKGVKKSNIGIAAMPQYRCYFF